MKMKKSKWQYGVLLSLLLVGCSNKHNAYYYASHPKALQQALSQCPQYTSAALSCDELHDINLKMHRLTYQLQDNQLAYGRKIIALQEQADQYQQQLNTHHDAEMAMSLKAIQAQIQEHLLPVQWLESPRNRT